MIVSEHRRVANKRNARLSTGPNTPRGKLVSSQNAVRHGLARPIWSDPAAAKGIEILAARLAGFKNEFFYRALARDVAECFFDVERVRNGRAQVLYELFTSVNADPNKPARIVDQLEKMWRYERRVRSKYRKALRAFREATPSHKIPKDGSV
jgi:hypothetical protein